MLVGYCNNIAKVSSSIDVMPFTTFSPKGSALVLMTLSVCGLISSDKAKVERRPRNTLQAILIASAAAVASSRSDALAISIPVRSQTIV